MPFSAIIADIVWKQGQAQTLCVLSRAELEVFLEASLVCRDCAEDELTKVRQVQHRLIFALALHSYSVILICSSKGSSLSAEAAPQVLGTMLTCV